MNKKHCFILLEICPRDWTKHLVDSIRRTLGTATQPQPGPAKKFVFRDFRLAFCRGNSKVLHGPNLDGPNGPNSMDWPNGPNVLHGRTEWTERTPWTDRVDQMHLDCLDWPNGPNVLHGQTEWTERTPYRRTEHLDWPNGPNVRHGLLIEWTERTPWTANSMDGPNGPNSMDWPNGPNVLHGPTAWTERTPWTDRVDWMHLDCLDWPNGPNVLHGQTEWTERTPWTDRLGRMHLDGPNGPNAAGLTEWAERPPWTDRMDRTYSMDGPNGPNAPRKQHHRTPTETATYSDKHNSNTPTISLFLFSATVCEAKCLERCVSDWMRFTVTCCEPPNHPIRYPYEWHSKLSWASLLMWWNL